MRAGFRPSPGSVTGSGLFAEVAATGTDGEDSARLRPTFVDQLPTMLANDPEGGEQAHPGT